MRKILLALVLMNSAAAFAGTVDLAVKPVSPIVIVADAVFDGNIIPGPWFLGEYTISNNSSAPVTVTALELEVVSDAGVPTKSVVQLSQPTEVSPGSVIPLREIYTGHLPKSYTYIYQVKVNAVGWMGGVNAPGERLAVSFSFVTQ